MQMIRYRAGRDYTRVQRTYIMGGPGVARDWYGTSFNRSGDDVVAFYWGCPGTSTRGVWYTCQLCGAMAVEYVTASITSAAGIGQYRDHFIVRKCRECSLADIIYSREHAMIFAKSGSSLCVSHEITISKSGGDSRDSVDIEGYDNTMKTVQMMRSAPIGVYAWTRYNNISTYIARIDTPRPVYVRVGPARHRSRGVCAGPSMRDHNLCAVHSHYALTFVDLRQSDTIAFANKDLFTVPTGVAFLTENIYVEAGCNIPTEQHERAYDIRAPVSCIYSIVTQEGIGGYAVV